MDTIGYLLCPRATKWVVLPGTSHLFHVVIMASTEERLKRLEHRSKEADIALKQLHIFIEVLKQKSSKMKIVFVKIDHTFHS